MAAGVEAVAAVAVQPQAPHLDWHRDWIRLLFLLLPAARSRQQQEHLLLPEQPLVAVVEVAAVAVEAPLLFRDHNLQQVACSF